MHGLTGPGRVPFRSTPDRATELRPRSRRRTDHLSPDNDRRRRPRSSSPAGPGTGRASTTARAPGTRTSRGTRTTRCAPAGGGTGSRCGWGATAGWCRTTALVAGAVEYLLRPIGLRC